MTLEDKREAMIERILQGAFEDFDMRYSNEEIEEMLDNDTYYDKVYNEPLEIDGYEKATLKEMLELPYKDILTIHNIIYG